MGSEYKIVAGNGSALCSANGNLVVGVVRDDEPPEYFDNPDTRIISELPTVTFQSWWHNHNKDEVGYIDGSVEVDEYDNDSDIVPVEYKKKDIVARFSGIAEDANYDKSEHDDDWECTFRWKRETKLDAPLVILGLKKAEKRQSSDNPNLQSLYVTVATYERASTKLYYEDIPDNFPQCFTKETNDVVEEYVRFVEFEFKEEVKLEDGQFVSHTKNKSTRTFGIFDDYRLIQMFSVYTELTCTLYLDDIFPPAS